MVEKRLPVLRVCVLCSGGQARNRSCLVVCEKYLISRGSPSNGGLPGVVVACREYPTAASAARVATVARNARIAKPRRPFDLAVPPASASGFLQSHNPSQLSFRLSSLPPVPVPS